MVNLVVSNRRRRFYLWLDPRLPSVRKQVSLFGRVETTGDEKTISPLSAPVAGSAQVDTILGIEQPAQRRVLRAEILLENYRLAHLSGYPARARAALVFDRLEDAWLYHDTNSEILTGHILKIAETRGFFAISLHDSLWTEILKTYTSDAIDESVSRAYWVGETTLGRLPDGMVLNRPRRPERIPTLEGLFYGALHFSDQQLERHDLPRPAAVRARLAAWGLGDWNLTHEPGEESATIAFDPEEEEAIGEAKESEFEEDFKSPLESPC